MIAAAPAPGSAAPPHETPYDAIGRWARRASPGRLAFWLAGGGAAAAGVALVAPRLWILASGLVALASIGAWGLAAQREMRFGPGGRRSVRVLLHAIRIASAAIGTAAAIVGFYGLLLVEGGQGWGPSGG